MIDIWTLKYNTFDEVWRMKSITEEGVVYTYIKNNNAIITRHDSDIANLWVKNPKKFIRDFFNITDDHVKYAVVDVVTNYARIVLEKNGQEYIMYCNNNQCFEIQSGDEEYFIPCKDYNKYIAIPNLNHTYVKPGNGYLKVKRCIKTPVGNKVLLALWRPGTYITRIFNEGEELKWPKWDWVAYNDWKWFIDDEGIHLNGTKQYRLDDVEMLFAVDGPGFSVLHSANGIDYIVTPKVVQKIHTGAKNARELFWKIFTGKYKFL